MKLNRILGIGTGVIGASLVFSSCLFIGCSPLSSPSAPSVEYKTIGGMDASAQALFNGYVDAIVHGQASSNGLHSVSVIYDKFNQDAALAATVASNGTNALAPEALAAEYAALTSAITTNQKK